jgi:hypothetical protein
MEVGEAGSIALGGIPVAVAVFVVIEALKWVGLLKGDNWVRIGVFITALLGGAVWAATQFWPEIVPFVSVIVTALVGSFLAALGYQAKEKLVAKRAA